MGATHHVRLALIPRRWVAMFAHSLGQIVRMTELTYCPAREPGDSTESNLGTPSPCGQNENVDGGRNYPMTKYW